MALYLPLPFVGILCVWCVMGLRCVAVSDLCARLQLVVQEVWELYFPGLAAWSGLCRAKVTAWTNALGAPQW